ncbi:efflux RND transporter periplasmic adaptor subunit [Salipiger mangrovisoli]|uniref:Efflux RND transporter periplasmic adaptor subunit n=1 Tax=Salipiger mangrovisoli TaxID=2865933 RepID=A0ABR9X4F1_9RHOB|nr:efflux RND transporter periplasmic adaptor subunit [Salipiger mangrovisoli]MBE9638386.1 efflux RND transporter periplasmic adaptor subunit [Salipiger mangrovisoli]
MKLISILTAILVAAVLYAVVLDRDRLMGWARGGAQEQQETATAASQDPPAAPAEAATVAGAVAVMARHSQAQEIDDAVLLRGETQPSREVEVLSEASGRVISTPLRKGSMVEEGAVLCELDPGTTGAALVEAEARLAEARAQRPQVEAALPEAEALLAQAEAAVAEAEINLTAARELSQGGYSSRTSVASAEAKMRAAEASVRSAEAGLEAARAGTDSLEASIQSAEAAVATARKAVGNLTITAPFGGVLESDTAELGLLMSTTGNASCAHILQLDPIRLVGYAPEADVARIRLGARAGAQLTGGQTQAGTVTFVSRQADETTRTFRIEVTLENPDLTLRAGQTARILIEADGALAHLLPQSALTLNDEGRMGLRTVSAEQTAQFMPVSILRDTPEGVWIAGLPDSVDVITLGQEYVTDGVPVAPSYQEILQ